MKKKLVGIVVFGLLITNALSIMGVGNEVKNIVGSSSTYNTQNLDKKGNICSVQTIYSDWNKTFGGPEYDMIYCVHETNDGGFIASGSQTFSGISYAWVLKLDSNGNEEWNISLPSGDPNDAWHWAMFVIQTKDDGYIVSGLNGSEITGDGFLMKVDSTGVIEWKKIYPYGDGQYGPVHCVQEFNDGYIAVGASRESSASGIVGMIFKTDLLGNVEWRKTYYFSRNQDMFWSIRVLLDGKFIIGGTAAPAGNSDYWIMKTDSSGNEEWNYTYGGSLNDFSYCRDCLPTDDGGYVMTGCTYSFSGGSGLGDVWVVKTDASGQMEWNKTYGETDEHDICWSMDTSHDGGYIITAAKNYGGVVAPKGELWLIKTDSDGNIVRSETFGGQNEDRGYFVKKTSDGGYITSGRTESFGDVNSDGWILKLSSFENEKPGKPDTPTGQKKGKVGTDYIYSSSSTDSDGDQLYYLWDWGDGNFSEWLGPFNSGDVCEATYNWTEGGTYDVKVKSKDIYEAESDWSDPLSVTMPRSRMINHPLLLRLLERFQNLFSKLQYILGFE